MFSNISVKAKLFILLFIPVVALVLLSAQMANDRYQTAQAMDELSNMVDIAVDSGNLIHEMQKERGYSAGFVSSKGKLFRPELREQRAVTAKANANFENTLNLFNKRYPATRLSNNFASVVQKVRALQNMYSAIDALTEPPSKVIAQYSGMITELQDGLDNLLEHGKDATIYGHTVNFIALINGKEFAGQERATLNAALSAGSFTPALYRGWIERVALQKKYLDTFFVHVEEIHKNTFTQQTASVMTTVEQFRKAVIESLDNPKLDGDPQAWFAASTQYINTLHDIELVVSNDLKKSSIALQKNAYTSFSISVVLCLAVLLVTFILTWIIIRNITVPLSHTVAFARNVARGELDQELSLRRDDEFGALAQALKAMLDSLKAMIDKADKATKGAQMATDTAKQATRDAEAAQQQAVLAKQEGMRAAACQLSAVVTVLASASENLSSQIGQARNGARDQSGRMIETATAMEEMNSTVLEVAKNSANAAETADSARHQAQQGADMVTMVIGNIDKVLANTLHLKTGMTALGDRALEIGKVLNVISDIADQTNLLALNAAIEAARAGEAGRGFAVVADEVRKLAEKTMTATKEVANVISGIQQDTTKNIESVDIAVQEMDKTTASAKESGKALADIVHLVDLTTDQIRSIATASEEQSATSEEINRSIGDVNNIAQNTTETMTLSSDAVNELARQVHILEKLIVDLQSS